MAIIGIDPGKKGAMCALPDGYDVAEVVPTPILIPPKKRGQTQRPEYDLEAIRDQLVRWKSEWGPILAIIEKPRPMHRRNASGKELGGILANFNRGVSRGWEWMLVALSIDYRLVGPQTWQKVMHNDTPDDLERKERSVIAAKRLFPNVELRRSPRSRKDDDGMAEALLLAEYGRRTRNGNT